MRKSLVIMICLSIGVLIASCGSGRSPDTANSGEKTDKQNQSSSTSPAPADPDKGGADSNTEAAPEVHSSEAISPEDPNSKLLELELGDTLEFESVKLSGDGKQCTIIFRKGSESETKEVTFDVFVGGDIYVKHDDGKVFAKVEGNQLRGFVVVTWKIGQPCLLCLTAGESTFDNRILYDPLVRIEFFPSRFEDGWSSTLLLGTSGIRSGNCVKSIKIEAGKEGKYKFKGTVTTMS